MAGMVTAPASLATTQCCKRSIEGVPHSCRGGSGVSGTASTGGGVVSTPGVVSTAAASLSPPLPPVASIAASTLAPPDPACTPPVPSAPPLP
ncbi:MAG TPA: hypothetical protein VGL59_06680 [Polyangia bacterium]